MLFLFEIIGPCIYFNIPFEWGFIMSVEPSVCWPTCNILHSYYTYYQKMSLNTGSYWMQVSGLNKPNANLTKRWRLIAFYITPSWR